MQPVNPVTKFSYHVMPPSRQFPNNLKLPVLYYKHVLLLGADPEKEVMDLFQSNNWGNFWKDSIFNYYHYHSNAHEVLAVIEGECMLQLGGDDGNIQKIYKGDVLVIPAGVAHKSIINSEDFKCIGAYPDGQDYDINYGKPEEREKADENIAKVALPTKDPIFGDKGPVNEVWKNERSDKVIEQERQF